MSESDRAASISKAQTLDEIADFWDTHSLADYWDQTREVEFEVRAKRRRRVTLDPDVYTQVEARARARGVLLKRWSTCGWLNDCNRRHRPMQHSSGDSA